MLSQDVEIKNGMVRERVFDERLRAPKGGVSIQGKEYEGGEFIPSSVNQEEAKKAIEAKKKENEEKTKEKEKPKEKEGEKEGEKEDLLLMKHPDPYVRRKVASRIDNDGLYKMMKDDDAKVRCEVASRIDNDGLYKMIDDPDPYVRLEVARRIDNDGLYKMIDDPDPYVRFEVARRIDNKGLHKMMKDDDAEVRCEVASRIDNEGLHKMINDPDPYVRRKVASRIDNKGLHKMMKDDDAEVRDTVARRIDNDGLHKMMNDINDVVRSTVTARLDNIIKITPQVLSEAKKFHEGKRKDFPELSDQVKEEIRSSDNCSDLLDEFFKECDMSSIHTKIREEWLASSNNKGSAILRDSAMRLFGGKVYKHNNYVDFSKEVKQEYSRMGITEKQADEYLKMLYGLTQKVLDAKFPGQETLKIYRGTSDEEVEKAADKFIAKQNAVSSWTTKKEVADKFARKTGEKGVVISTKCKKSEILSMFSIYSYTGRENEIMLIGKDREVTKERE
jgi:hypothetical protein